VESLLELGNKVVSIKSLRDKPSEGIHFIYAENGNLLGDHAKQLREKLLPEAKRFIQSGIKIKLIRLPEIEGELLFELFEPRKKLYIFGAGPDVEPLARLASSSDFFVTIIDPRGARCNESIFPTANQLILEHSESYLENNKIPDNSFVLVMTHSFQQDQNILHQLIQAPLYYLGVLGPRRRTERLLAPDLLPDQISSPIGLSIGAEGPEEISISIMAELLKVRNKTQRWQESEVLFFSA
jgi:xanthine dehydrogenase accessory factor